ncbi:hydantoinase/oxoprolinase family protein [Terrihabitans sp. B22-R8]|uniref:hydantoinase/oxoprolinase family protein n=1 Tax=Terrihabitans sp. B22-R8 TaxID=3425128 RepID=UPI00403CA62D
MIIGIDVGGTFTDLVASGGRDGIEFVKMPSTPDDPARAVLDALDVLAERQGRHLPDLLAEIEVFIHGTTVATNTLVQRKGAKLGLITTRGFRDLLEMREGARDRRYTLRRAEPEPLVPRPLRLEVAERLRADGEVERPLDAEELDAAIAALRGEGVEGVAVCFLHAHRNSAHEDAVRAAIHDAGWDAYVSLGHDLLGQQGEYDRLSTAVVNAYIGPGLQAYLGRLSNNLRDRGIAVPVFVMQSTGGVLPVEAAGRRAVGAVTSGPAGGAMAGALFARELGIERLVTYDTGGTTTDIALIENGVPVERQRTDHEDLRIAVPGIDVNPLGIGGGSLARVDASGILTIGPESAGAVPGAACFLRGGTRATLTDANLVLGLIDPDNFLGGRMRLSVDAARTAIETDIARPLGISVEEAAWALHVLASSRIAEGVRLATVRRGKDPRDFALMSFGGAGGLHADEVAVDLEIPRVVIPQMASVLSALGFLAADIRQDREGVVNRAIRDLDAAGIEAIFAALEADARAQLAATGVGTGDIRVVRQMDCRYGRQVHGIPVVLGEDYDPSSIEAAFTDRYRELYGHAHEDEPAMIETCRVSVLGTLPKISLPNQTEQKADAQAARSGTRTLYLGRPVEAGIYRFEALAPGMSVAGPAIIESTSTTILVGEGRQARLDRTGSLDLGAL